MDRINRIINHEKFITSIKKTKSHEKKRKYCKHGLRHLMDVSRIGYIIALENNVLIPKDIIYAAGLLHDIGKYLQYEKNIPHNKASVEIAPEILLDCGYNNEEIKQIVSAIDNHRELITREENSLEYILYKADKSSRNCFYCKKRLKCDWNDSKKNMEMQM